MKSERLLKVMRKRQDQQLLNRRGTEEWICGSKREREKKERLEEAVVTVNC